MTPAVILLGSALVAILIAVLAVASERAAKYDHAARRLRRFTPRAHWPAPDPRSRSLDWPLDRSRIHEGNGDA